MFNTEQFMNSNTLNIFCDGSIKNSTKGYIGCYGALGVCYNTDIDEFHRIGTGITNNCTEIRAITEGICMAIRQSKVYNQFNIFSDSQISVFGIRDRYLAWVLKDDGLLYGVGNEPIKSQDVFVEALYLLKEHPDVNIRFWHQKGHVTANDIDRATHVFRSSNEIRDDIDPYFIRYISFFNDRIDHITRDALRDPGVLKKNYVFPVRFSPVKYYGELNNNNTIEWNNNWR